MNFTIRQGMNQDILKDYPANHFDSIVTDPPYGIEFLGKDWDKNTGAVETWEECFRVLKPGGHLLAFSAARTYHHLATNIESVGFEIRDQIMWIYGSGFPKAQDVGKAIDRRADKEHPEAQQWAGWKTALKPAHEPIVMARKPFKGSTIDNVLEHGVGALNIDETRIPYLDEADMKSAEFGRDKNNNFKYIDIPEQMDYNRKNMEVVQANPDGRFPSNVIGEIPDYQKYFYCPKVSRAERHCGFEKMTIPAPFGDVQGCYKDGKRFAQVHQDLQKGSQPESRGNGSLFNTDGSMRHSSIGIGDPSTGNNHPTVKPVELMKYLIKLVTPPGGKVLDPFNGSGSTGMAAVELGYEYVGCDLDPNYVEIANRRIQGWYERTRPNNNFNDLFS